MPHQQRAGCLGEKFPETRQRELSTADVSGMSLVELRDAINEMFVRHGADLPNADIKRHCQKFPWYRPRPGLDFDEIEDDFSDIERVNLKLLGAAGDTKGGRK